VVGSIRCDSNSLALVHIMRGDIRRDQSSFARYTKSKLDYLLFDCLTCPDQCLDRREWRRGVESVYDGPDVRYMADFLIISLPPDAHEMYTPPLSPQSPVCNANRPGAAN
jgi:hypothetical protein